MRFFRWREISVSPIRLLANQARQRISPTRAVLALSVGAVIAILASTALLLWDLREREKAHALGEITSLSRILAEQTTRAFDGADLVLRGVQDRLTDGIGQTLPLDSQIVFFLLRARVSSLPQVASVFVTDADGKVLNSSRGTKIGGHSVRDQRFFSVWQQRYEKDLFVSTPMRSRVDQRWSLYLSRPLYNPQGLLRGVVVVNVDLGYFEGLYSSISLDFVSPIFLMLADGALLVSQPPNEAMIGQRAVNPDATKPTEKDGNLRLIEERGVRTLAFRAVSGFPLAVGVAIGEQEALTPWRSIAWQISIGGLLVSLAILLAGWGVAREMRREQGLLAALRDSNQQLRELSGALQSVRENERTRIARELHDELGQKLTGLKFELSWLLGRLKKNQPELVGKIGDMKRLLVDTIEEVRRISSELRPLMLDDLGFAAAAEWMAQDFSRRTGVEVILDLSAAEAVTGDPLATTLFRVLQESLTNIARHAGATEVSVSLTKQLDKLVLQVTDNGRGLPTGDSKIGGFGLVGMRERVVALDGRLSVEDIPGGGVLIQVEIPLLSSREEDE